MNCPGGRGTGKIAARTEKGRNRTVSLVMYWSLYLDIRRICGCFALPLESCKLALVSKGSGDRFNFLSVYYALNMVVTMPKLLEKTLKLRLTDGFRVKRS